MYIPMILGRSMKHCADIVQRDPIGPLDQLNYKYLIQSNIFS